MLNPFRKSTAPAPAASNLRAATGRQRGLRLALIFVLTVVAGSVVEFPELERNAQALRQAAYAKYYGGSASLIDRARKQVVIVELSDDSFATLGVPPPVLPRTFHAKLIRELNKAGAKVIVFDILFFTPRPEDKELAAAANEKHNVVWGSIFEDYEGARRKLNAPGNPLLAASPHLGHVHFPLKIDDSRVDRVEPLILPRDANGAELKDVKATPVASLSAEAVRLALGEGHSPWQRTAEGWRAGRVNIPLDPQTHTHFLIKFSGQDTAKKLEGNPGATEQTLDFSKQEYSAVHAGVADDPFFRADRTFQDKIVIVGNTTTAAGDDADTPIGRMAGVEVHAHAIATLLEGNYIRNAPARTDFLVLAGLAALLCFLASRLHWRWIGPAAFGMVTAYSIANICLYMLHGYAMKLASPDVWLVLATAAILVERGVLEEHERKRATALLQRHLSPQIADYVLNNPDMLDTRRVTATVLFSDIRGFTAMSEKLTPEEVVVRLNEYLQQMTDAVFAHEGAVDKYIGDAIMALYNTPMPQADHARRAVATAIDMQTALLKLQAKWRGEGLPVIDIGIGINTGEMVVGYMGATERLDFTVIGDAVNLASRVESLNKEMGSRILITEATYGAVRDEVAVRGPLKAFVKGKEEEVTVYEVYGWTKTS